MRVLDLSQGIELDLPESLPFGFSGDNIPVEILNRIVETKIRQYCIPTLRNPTPELKELAYLGIDFIKSIYQYKETGTEYTFTLDTSKFPPHFEIL